MRTSDVAFAEEFGAWVMGMSMFHSLRRFTVTGQINVIEEDNHNA